MTGILDFYKYFSILTLSALVRSSFNVVGSQPVSFFAFPICLIYIYISKPT
jgi:hypothetical protein